MADSDLAPDHRTAAAVWWPVVVVARWYQGKSRDGVPGRLRPLPWLVDTPALRVRPELLDVSYPDGPAEVYQLLTAYRPLPGVGGAVVGTVRADGVAYAVGDATKDPEAMAAVVPHLCRTARDEAAGRGVLRTTYARPLPAGDLTPRVFAGEQSNTNVPLGDIALIKIFRRLEPGANLDREITDRLIRAGVGAVPTLYGWLEGEIDGVGYDLAMLSELLPEPIDGWGLATGSCRSGGDFTGDAAALGEALGHVHQALAGDRTTLAGEEVADAMADRLRAAVAAAPALEPYEAALAMRFDALRGRRLAAQPVHGDFHLGQTLKTPLGWRIIDFEGEPLKSMAERRRPDSPWRDVAGMLRSLSYATSTSDDPQGPEAAQWVRSAREAFLRAYRETAGTDTDENVLTAYEADKAAYEVVYETRNRPSWVTIPLGAVATLTTPTASTRS